MTLNIKVKSGSTEPSKRPPPGDRRGTAIVSPGRTNPADLPVYITRDCHSQILAYARRGGEFEVGGFLLGGYHVWAGHRYVDIDVQVPALKAKSAKTHLTFSNDAQREFHAIAAQRYPDKLVLGWVHSHPGYSVFLSEYDLFIQRGFFASPHHVAVVVDPYQHAPQDRVGVFVWEEGKVSAGYHLIVYERG